MKDWFNYLKPAPLSSQSKDSDQRKQPTKNKNSQHRGERAEHIAAQYLQQQGLQLLQQNYRCKRGEIDLIMLHNNTLCFIEVRLRRHHAFASAAASVDFRKQQKVIATAEHYLQQTRDSRPCRFDVIALETLAIDSIQWLPNAFDAST